MKVFITSAYNDSRTTEWLLSNDPDADSLYTKDPETADVIIFAENHPGHDPYFRAVLKNKVYKRYKHKCVLYHDADRSITPMPTLSPSIEAWQFDHRHKGSFHYISRLCENDAINNGELQYSNDRKFLYSFIGSRTHKIRSEIFSLQHPSNTYIKDTTGFRAWELNSEQKLAYEKEYFSVLQESYFILSPRGVGPCTYRLFESLQMGRVPVIISDDWLKVPDVNWDKFSITIPESRIHQIPFILTEMLGDAVEMGKEARKHWEKYFSPAVSLRRLSTAALGLISHRYSFSDSIKDYSQFIKDKWHFRNLLRYKVKKHLRR